MAIREIPFLLAASMLHAAVPVAASWMPRPLTVRPLLAGHLTTTEITVDVDYEAPESWQQLPPEAIAFREPRSAARHAYEPPDPRQLEPRPDPTSEPTSEHAPPEVMMAPDGASTSNDYDQPPSAGDYTGTWGWPGGPRAWALTPGGMPHLPSEAAP